MVGVEEEKTKWKEEKSGRGERKQKNILGVFMFSSVCPQSNTVSAR